MMTQCTRDGMLCKRIGRRDVVADFSGGRLTSDGGVLLMGAVDEKTDLLERFAELFTDRRDPDRTEHTALELLRQRVYGITLSYEDLNDHDELSRDFVIASAVGKADPTGESRVRERDKGRALAGKSTLNRLELSVSEQGRGCRYRKIALDMEGAERFFARHFVATHRKEPDVLVLDFDPTDDPLHGQQEGRFFNGYYDEYLYMPLYVFCGEELLLAKQRPGDVDAPEGTVEVLEWLVPMLRERWPKVRLIVRADASFAREEIMSWCEEHGVDYVLGLAKNSVLLSELEEELAQAQARYERTGERARVYKDFLYQTNKSWSRERRVVGKAEYSRQGPNRRFVVTSLGRRGRYGWGRRRLYEKLYCGRGNMENRIKEQQLYLFADRTSTRKLLSNQLRLWFSSLAYTLMNTLRREGLKGTELEGAQCDTIRLKLLKIAALVRVSKRRVWVALCSSYPWKNLLRKAWTRIQNMDRAPLWSPQRC